MLDPTPNVNCRYGAPMGRRSHDGGYTVNENAAPMHLVKIRIDSGGYDSGGAYWGIGDPVFYFEAHVTDIRGYVRARDRTAAKAEVRSIHPAAKFFR